MMMKPQVGIGHCRHEKRKNGMVFTLPLLFIFIQLLPKFLKVSLDLEEQCDVLMRAALLQTFQKIKDKLFSLIKYFQFCFLCTCLSKELILAITALQLRC